MSSTLSVTGSRIGLTIGAAVGLTVEVAIDSTIGATIRPANELATVLGAKLATARRNARPNALATALAALLATARSIALAIILTPGVCAASSWRGHLDTEDLPPYLRDRGDGLALSMFGTYIHEGQFIVYPFFEYYRDSNAEYKPAELGYTEDRDYRGDAEASEELIFLAYGISDRLAIELEAAVIQAELEKRPGDAPELPDEIEEDGLGDVEGQLRWRWAAENVSRPEVFSYFEFVFPTQDEGSLIGTSDWEFKLGTGVSRGFSFGSLTGRVAVEYDGEENKLAPGEIAVEYLRRLSPHWRVFGGFEGSEDEWEAIPELQLHVSRHVFFKFNSAFGITSKAAGWAPEVGVVFSL